MQISSIAANHFLDYELIDSGYYLKLERFGQYITIRPEPQAVWQPALTILQWKELAHVEFIAKSSSSGEWQKLKPMPDNWTISYSYNNQTIAFNLALTKFKHVGIFPEQCTNWEYIFQQVKRIKTTTIPCRVLNLFAYTGGASLAAKAAGADVTHVDAIKQVVSWANRNMVASNLTDIRWVVEDALKFVKREVKRGKSYHGIILDPPAYGHGPNGESWKLEHQINEMIDDTLKLLDKEHNFYILNTYSLGFSSLILYNLLNYNLCKHNIATQEQQLGEIYIPSKHQQKLPLGVFYRFNR